LNGLDGPVQPEGADKVAAHNGGGGGACLTGRGRVAAAIPGENADRDENGHTNSHKRAHSTRGGRRCFDR
jgi:hypothetical protein